MSEGCGGIRKKNFAPLVGALLAFAVFVGGVGVSGLLGGSEKTALPLFLSLLISPLIALWVGENFRKGLLKSLKEKFFSVTLSELLLALILGLGLNFVFTFLMVLVATRCPEVARFSEDVGNLLRNSSPVLMFFLVVILSPVCEELVFRGIIGKILLVYGAGWACFLSSLLFALAHFQIVAFFYAFPLGCVAFYLFNRRGSLLLPVVFHAVVNLTTFLIARCVM